jgi:chromosomal replication initiation ATPase DnaA
MRRTALNALQEWKQRSSRKPFIIRGTRQVGKTWLMKEFVRTSMSDFKKEAWLTNLPLYAVSEITALGGNVTSKC